MTVAGIDGDDVIAWVEKAPLLLLMMEMTVSFFSAGNSSTRRLPSKKKTMQVH